VRLRREAITLVVGGDTDILVLVTNLAPSAVTSGLALLRLRSVVTLAVRSVTSLLDLVTDEALHTVLGGLAVLTHLGEGVLYKFIIRKTYLVIVIWWYLHHACCGCWGHRRCSCPGHRQVP
jgi:hypothetical protein